MYCRFAHTFQCECLNTIIMLHNLIIFVLILCCDKYVSLKLNLKYKHCLKLFDTYELYDFNKSSRLFQSIQVHVACHLQKQITSLYIDDIPQQNYHVRFQK